MRIGWDLNLVGKPVFTITLSEMKRHLIIFQITLLTIPKNGQKTNFIKINENIKLFFIKY